VSQFGWSGHSSLDDASKAEISFIWRNLKFFHGYPAQSPATEVSVVSIIGPPEEFLSKLQIQGHRAIGTQCVWASDASAFGTFAYSIKSPVNLDSASNFSEKEMTLSSGLRELLAVVKALPVIIAAKSKEDPWHIYWLTDSTNLVAFLSKGSMKSHIQPYIFHIIKSARLNNICITPIHLKRDDERIKKADAGSRNNASDDWGVEASCFQKYCKETHFTIDLFASAVSKRTERFYSYNTEDVPLGAGSLGVNAFCHSWDGEVAWVCPPVSQIIPTIRKIKAAIGLKGILVVPEWRSAGFWTFIFDNEELKKPFTRVQFRKPYIVQFQRVTDTALYGKTDFNIVFLQFES